MLPDGFTRQLKTKALLVKTCTRPKGTIIASTNEDDYEGHKVKFKADQ